MVYYREKMLYAKFWRVTWNSLNILRGRKKWLQCRSKKKVLCKGIGVKEHIFSDLQVAELRLFGGAEVGDEAGKTGRGREWMYPINLTTIYWATTHQHPRCWKYSGEQDKVIAPMLRNLKFILKEIRRFKAKKWHVNVLGILG